MFGNSVHLCRPRLESACRAEFAQGVHGDVGVLRCLLQQLGESAVTYRFPGVALSFKQIPGVISRLHPSFLDEGDEVLFQLRPVGNEAGQCSVVFRGLSQKTTESLRWISEAKSEKRICGWNGYRGEGL